MKSETAHSFDYLAVGLGVGLLCGFFVRSACGTIRNTRMTLKPKNAVVQQLGTKMKTFDPAKMENPYKFFISAIIPRPIALVSTISPEGVVNVAPFSYFNMMSHDPPVLVFSVNNKQGQQEKDTLRNIRTSHQCVVNIVSSWYLDQANLTSGNFPSNISEMNEAKLHKIDSVTVQPPRIKESAVHFECQVSDIYPLHKEQTKEEKANIVICSVSMIHVNESIYDEAKGIIQYDKLSPISRLGGISYAELGRVVAIPRPK